MTLFMTNSYDLSHLDYPSVYQVQQRPELLQLVLDGRAREDEPALHITDPNKAPCSIKSFNMVQYAWWLLSAAVASLYKYEYHTLMRPRISESSLP